MSDCQPNKKTTVLTYICIAFELLSAYVNFFAVMIRKIQAQTSLHIDQRIIRFLGNTSYRVRVCNEVKIQS